MADSGAVMSEADSRAFKQEMTSLLPQVRAFASSCLRIVAAGYAFYAWGMVMVQSFNGAGDTLTPTIINLCCYWFLQIPLAYALAFTMNFGALGVFWAIPIAEAVLAVVGVMAFRRGKWKTQEV